MTQFQPGQSGNPVGRPKGSVNHQLKMLREAAELILPLVLERALNGDADAQKLIIERGMPRMKSVASSEPFILPNGSLAEQMQALLQQVAEGELSATAATQAIGLVIGTTKAKEVEAYNAARKALPMQSCGSTYLAAIQAKYK